MYAGPLPEIAVTASWCRSGSRTTFPQDLSSDSASARCSGVQCRPGEIAAIPSSTSAGVLGMTRTTDDPSGRRDSRYAVGMPRRARPRGCPARLVVDLAEQPVHVLRLDHQDDGVGQAGGLDVVEYPHAVLVTQHARMVGALLGDDDVLGVPSTAQQPGQQRLAHDPVLEDRRRRHGGAALSPAWSARSLLSAERSSRRCHPAWIAAPITFRWRVTRADRGHQPAHAAP